MAIYLNFATGFNLPPYWKNHPVTLLGYGDDGMSVVSEQLAKTGDDATGADEYLGNLYQCPIRVKWQSEKEWWTLPLDPVVSVAGKNTIIRRNVLKAGQDNRRGSIKELWSQDDYEVTIAGALIGKPGQMPEADLRKLRKYCEGRRTLMVESALFSILNISKIAIEDYSLPFTKGVENQTYTIKGYSDDAFGLLVKERRK